MARLSARAGGGPVWEAVASSVSQTGEFRTRREPYELVVELVFSLVGSMPVRGPAYAAPG